MGGKDIREHPDSHTHPYKIRGYNGKREGRDTAARSSGSTLDFPFYSTHCITKVGTPMRKIDNINSIFSVIACEIQHCAKLRRSAKHYSTWQQRTPKYYSSACVVSPEILVPRGLPRRMGEYAVISVHNNVLVLRGTPKSASTVRPGYTSYCFIIEHTIK